MLSSYVSCEYKGQQEAELDLGKTSQGDAEKSAHAISDEKRIQVTLAKWMGLLGIPTSLIALAIVRKVKAAEKLVTI